MTLFQMIIPSMLFSGLGKNTNMKELPYEYHVLWNHVQMVLTKKLDNKEVAEIYKELKHFYDTSLVISDKMDELFS